MLPSFGLPPLKFCFGTRPTQAEKFRPDRNAFGSGTLATRAVAICVAVRRPTMRFVETKAPEQQSCLMLHRTRHLVVRQLNAVTNALCGHSDAQLNRQHSAHVGSEAPREDRLQKSCRGRGAQTGGYNAYDA